jgi:serine/threonine protein kinase
LSQPAADPSGVDNINMDLLVRVNDEFLNSEKERGYVVKEFLGKGVFGQVFLVEEKQGGKSYAAKVIKSDPNLYEYTMQCEVKTLTVLNKFERAIKNKKTEVPLLSQGDLSESRIVRMRDFFKHKGHMVMIFEKLSMSLYDLLRVVEFHGLTLNLIRTLSRYMVEALLVMKLQRYTHCDLKPENIMLVE